MKGVQILRQEIFSIKRFLILKPSHYVKFFFYELA